VRHLHHIGADGAHADGAISSKRMFPQRFIAWHGCCNAVAVRYPFAQSGATGVAMNINNESCLGQ
jgi:hypothetical protein